jgi:hypothetical protein
MPTISAVILIGQNSDDVLQIAKKLLLHIKGVTFQETKTG